MSESESSDHETSFFMEDLAESMHTESEADGEVPFEDSQCHPSISQDFSRDLYTRPLYDGCTVSFVESMLAIFQYSMK